MTAFPPLARRALIALLVLTLGSALAHDRIEVGVGIYPAGALAATAHVAFPLFEAREITHGLRGDLTYAFAGLPALAASYTLTGAPEEGAIDRYLGAGIGLAFADAPLSSPQLSAHGLAGVRVPLGERFHVFSEVVVAGNAIETRLDLGLGVRFAFGGSN